jgi:hypothetical protein
LQEAEAKQFDLMNKPREELRELPQGEGDRPFDFSVRRLKGLMTCSVATLKFAVELVPHKRSIFSGIPSRTQQDFDARN